MFREQSTVNAFFINFILGVIWHYAVLFVCISLDNSVFSPERKLYHCRKWECGGKFYSDVLKINKWKDTLPQHIGKDGFSKEHIEDVSIKYLDKFILETCRGEWNHKMNCVLVVVLFGINGVTGVSVILSFATIAGNMPFICIQRYNRFRLQRLKKTLLRKMERQNKMLVCTTAENESLTE